jgi:hypothetical protein
MKVCHKCGRAESEVGKLVSYTTSFSLKPKQNDKALWCESCLAKEKNQKTLKPLEN